MQPLQLPRPALHQILHHPLSYILDNLFHPYVLQAPRQVKMKVRFQVSHRKIPLQGILNLDAPADCFQIFVVLKAVIFQNILQRQDLKTIQGLVSFGEYQSVPIFPRRVFRIISEMFSKQSSYNFCHRKRASRMTICHHI